MRSHEKWWDGGYESPSTSGNACRKGMSRWPLPSISCLLTRLSTPWYEVFEIIGKAPDRRLVFRPSTSAEVAHILARLKHHRSRDSAMLRHLAINLVKICLHPSNARNFNFAVPSDPEDGRDVCQTVGV
jgi:hypothetical protein